MHNPLPALKLRRRHALNDVSLDLVADFHVVEVFQTDAALETFAHFGNVILEPAQRSDVAFPAHHAIANDSRSRVAADGTVDHHAARNGSGPRHAENFAHRGLAENPLLLDGFEHADHGRANFFLDLVDDRVE